MEYNEEILRRQKIWESLILPKDYVLNIQHSNDPVIFFILKGSISLKINGIIMLTGLPREMFMAQYDNSYEMIMLEQTQMLICHTPLEVWYSKQKWIDKLVSDEKTVSKDIVKLPLKKVIYQYLSLVDIYLKEGINSNDFFEIVRQELLFLLFLFYQKQDLALFLKCILSKDLQFKTFVMNNYLHAGNVQELAKLANYSTSGFIKKFQKCFKISPYNWMQKQKANQISVEINKGLKSLQEIANDFGFSSYQHFSYFCKAKLGATPTTFFENSNQKMGKSLNW